MVKCKSCGVSKAHEIVLRRPPTQSTVPFYRVYLDLIPGIVAYNGDRHAVYFLDDATRMNNIDIMA